MRFRIWGSRGSLSAPGPETVRYGGNTSCVELRTSDGTLIVLDAGTGIRNFGESVAEEMPKQVHLLLSHLHLDHLEGLGFFPPLWDPEVEIHVWGPQSQTQHLRERITKLLSPPLFPVHLSHARARMRFHDVPAEPWELGGVRITASPVIHCGPTLGYRIEEGGRSLAYISDHEPALGGDLRRADPSWVSGYALAREVDVLVHDSQYTEEEYPEKMGWGHSSTDHVVAFGLLAKAKQLILFHHDPLHPDGQLEASGRRAAELWGDGNTPPELAYEGMRFDLV